MTLTLDHITLAFGDRTLLRDCSLTISPGDFLVIRGASGSGKTSLLRLLNRLSEPSSGTILADGASVDDGDVTAYRRRVGYIQQTPVMLPGTVYDNLVLPFAYRSSDGDPPDRASLASDLADFNLADVSLDEPADTLSVGQKQRIALIRTLLTGPSVILCDEPTSALDPESRQIVEARLRGENAERSTTIVLVTHLDFEPGDLAVRDFTLSDGTLTETAA